jgi:hypothetical protein
MRTPSARATIAWTVYPKRKSPGRLDLTAISVWTSYPTLAVMFQCIHRGEVLRVGKVVARRRAGDPPACFEPLVVEAVEIGWPADRS